MLEQLTYRGKNKMNFVLTFTHYIKINSKCIKALNVKHEIIKLLEKKKKKTRMVFRPEGGKKFSDLTPKV